MTNPVVPIREESVYRPAELPSASGQIAAPAILGMYAFAMTTWVVAASMAGWFGTLQKDILLVPFAAMFGGLAQFLAGMWAFKSRDALASAFHSLWGAFYLGFGLVGLMAATRVLPLNQLNSAPISFGWWLVVLAITTWAMTGPAFKEGRIMGWFMALVSIGTTLSFIGDFVSGRYWTGVAGYFFLASAIVAWVIGTRLLGRSPSVLGSRRMGTVTSSETTVVGAQEVVR